MVGLDPTIASRMRRLFRAEALGSALALRLRMRRGVALRPRMTQ
jgi:hypothetical protein